MTKPVLTCRYGRMYSTLRLLTLTSAVCNVIGVRNHPHHDERTTPTMSATTTPATKYRIAIRDIAKNNGWSFTQTSTRTDRFEKNGAVVDVHHGPSNLITRAEKVDKGGHVETGRAGKMFDVQAWLTGQPDPDRRNFIRLSDEQIARFESGQGLAKIAVLDTTSPETPAPEPKPAAAQPTPAAAKPAPKSSSRTAKSTPKAQLALTT